MAREKIHQEKEKGCRLEKGTKGTPEREQRLNSYRRRNRQRRARQASPKPAS